MSIIFMKKYFFKSIKTTWLATLLTCLLSTSLLARNSQRIDYKNEAVQVCTTQICDPFHVIATLTGGAAFTQIGQSKTFYDDSSFYTYSSNSSTHSQAMWGGSIGEELRLFPDWALQLNLAYYQIYSYTSSGTVTQGVDTATAEIFPYQYEIIARQYLLESKILLDKNNRFHPYILGGIGASFNSASDYIANPGLITFTPQFENKTNISFSYSAGAGVDFDISKYARFGIGYRFAGLGNAKLGKGMINTAQITNSYGQENVNAQEAIAQITFII
ncbi:hypothetical protein N9L02_01780 [Gammaproteobacteria bacterium]|nr:hypothetical protein [Gammaproteobacteria bacterium]